MEFLEWLVIEECSKNYIEKYSIIGELLNIVNEAAKTTGFLEEKLNKKKKPTIKESWQNRLSKVNWKNILENDNEDEEGPIEINPFSDDDSAKPIEDLTSDSEYETESPETTSEKKRINRLNKLKKIKDAMLIIRWNAMKERDDLINILDQSNKEEKIEIVKKLGYIDDDEDVSDGDLSALVSKARDLDDQVPSQIRSILTPENVRKAKEDLGTLMYRIKDYTDEGEEIGGGILRKAIGKAHIDSQRQYSKSEIFSSFVTNLIGFLQNKKGKEWSRLPEGIGRFSDLEKDDNKTLNGIAYYLTGMVSHAPKEDARNAANQLNPQERKSWADTESGEGFRRAKDKITLINSDLRNNDFEFYLTVIDALRNIKVWDDNAKSQLKAIGTDEKDNKLRKNIISDMFIVKILPDAEANTPDSIKKLLNAYLRMIQKEQNEKEYRPVTHASSLRRNDDDGGGAGGEDIDIARYNNSMGSTKSSDDFGGATYDDPARLAADAEEKRLGRGESFFDAFKEAMDSLLKYKPNVGLAYCLSKNLDCSSGFPSVSNVGSPGKVKAKDVSTKMTEILKTPISQASVNGYIYAAKNYLIDHFAKNYPQFSDKILFLLGK